MSGRNPESTATRETGIDLQRRGRWDGAVQIARSLTPDTAEIHLCARPSKRSGSFPEQARSSYRNLLRELRAQGFSPADIAAEKVFFSDIDAQMEDLQRIRAEAYAAESRKGSALPATSYIQQPPARPRQLVEIQAYVLAPAGGAAWTARSLFDTPQGVSGKIIEYDGRRTAFIANVTGGARRNGMNSQGRAASMFQRAETILSWEGFSFQDVARTWIYIDDIDENYGALNRARNEFFTTRGIRRLPASTGIQGVPFPPDRGFSLDLRAYQGRSGIRMDTIHSATMNEADTYGSSFSRGMRVELPDRTLLYVSGTASIDTDGEVVHVGHIEGQVYRMLQNIESLLAAQNASVDDLVSLITYLKQPEFLDPFRSVYRRAGFPEDVPNTITAADVCRPEWLCEMEAVAVLG